MQAYHILRETMCPDHGDEPAWKLGEERTLNERSIRMCYYGYHYAGSLLTALDYGSESNCVATLVDVDPPANNDQADKLIGTILKGVSARRKLLAYCNPETTNLLVKSATINMLRWSATKGDCWGPQLLEVANYLEVGSELTPSGEHLVQALHNYAHDMVSQEGYYTHMAFWSFCRTIHLWYSSEARKHVNAYLTRTFKKLATYA